MKKKTNHLHLIIFAALSVVMIIAGYKVTSILRDYSKSDSLYKEAEEEYVTENKISEKSAGNGTLSDDLWSERISVDLEALQKENGDVVGWLYFENVDISYPILYSGDNTTYLHRGYTGETMTAGSIFVDGNNAPDFSDSHTVIYGHNMKNLSMFGRLKYYRQDTEYYKEHQYFQVITREYRYRYKIIAYREVDETSDIYMVEFSSDDDFEAFIDEQILPGMPVKVNEQITASDKIITLSTCSVEGKRFAISALRVDEKFYNL